MAGGGEKIRIKPKEDPVEIIKCKTNKVSYGEVVGQWKMNSWMWSEPHFGARKLSVSHEVHIYFGLLR